MIRELFGRYYSTQLNSLNVGVREVQSLEISLYHRVNKGSIKQDLKKYRRKKCEEKDNRFSFKHVRVGGSFQYVI